MVNSEQEGSPSFRLLHNNGARGETLPVLDSPPPLGRGTYICRTPARTGAHVHGQTETPTPPHRGRGDKTIGTRQSQSAGGSRSNPHPATLRRVGGRRKPLARGKANLLPCDVPKGVFGTKRDVSAFSMTCRGKNCGWRHSLRDTCGACRGISAG